MIAKFRNRALLFDETLIEHLNTDVMFLTYIMFDSLKYVVMEKRTFFVNFNTDFKISLCSRAQNLRYFEGQHQGYQMAFLNFFNLLLIPKIISLNLRSISFIANRSFLFITLYEGDVFVVVPQGCILWQKPNPIKHIFNT